MSKPSESDDACVRAVVRFGGNCFSENQTIQGYFLVDDLVTNIEGWINSGGTGILFRKDDPVFTDAEIERSKLI